MLMKAVSTLLLPVTRRAMPRTQWLGSLVREHRASLVRIAISEGLTGDEALDAVQEAAMTFLTRAMWMSLETKPDDAIRLLATLTRNQSRNARRRHGRDGVSIDQVLNRADESVSLDDAIQRAQDHVTLTGCIQTLKGAQRAVVMARLLEGDDVAKTLGLSPDNVAVTLHRARERLRVCIESSPLPRSE